MNDGERNFILTDEWLRNEEQKWIAIEEMYAEQLRGYK
jgi:hypothetical protein